MVLLFFAKENPWKGFFPTWVSDKNYAKLPTIEKLRWLRRNFSEVKVSKTYSALWFPLMLTKIPTYIEQMVAKTQKRATLANLFTNFTPMNTMTPRMAYNIWVRNDILIMKIRRVTLVLPRGKCHRCDSY